ncbi:unnamed protein product [Mytilus coruscus]|uniref:Mutator-like transposase domain-containing protein n=1 Tax=Mytilus coruscus TaxID=42192 RepID=A0A6J8CCY5_MYTCO|nr:unnamed protein product [Mytilus coruscus]
MAKKEKQLSKFGLPSCGHSSTRKSVSLFSGRQESEFECHLNVQEDFKIELIRKFRSLKRNKAKRINLWHKCSKKKYYIYRSKEGKYQKHTITNISASGYRLINLKSIQDHFTEITTHTMFCEAARTIAYNGGSAINLESQLSSYGLACILSARCTGCQKKFVLETSPNEKQREATITTVIAKTLKIDVEEHECFKNWDKSSQAMEADIIVEGFLKADKHGIRYMHLIGDGDSSVSSQIQQKVPVWGKHVKKIECANHTCKCLQSNLETPTYKGKGKLCKRTRIRITRCAIRMRSKEKDKLKAAKQLEFDIRNTLSHVYGDHTRCSEFCKAGKASKTNAGQHIDLDNDDTDDNVLTDQASMWSDGTSLEAQEESRFDYDLFPLDLDSAMRQDIALILNNVAKKSISLIGNFTTNLAECWMHMRSKFDGGKMFNHCNRGSWHTRCYGAVLRFNRGPKWSTSTWQDITNTIPGYHFDKLFTERQLALENNNIIKSKPEIKSSRWK